MAFGLSVLAGELSPLRYLPGVRKFRSWDEAIEARASYARMHRQRLTGGT